MPKLLALLGLAAVACASPGAGVERPRPTPDDEQPRPMSDDAQPPSTPGLSRDDAVLEAVFLYELAESPPVGDEGVCLTVRGGLSDALFAAIKQRYPTAVQNVECKGGGPTGRVKLVATDGDAVRFDIGPVTWDSDHRARCTGGGGHRGGGAREVEYTVEPAGGGWKVVAAKVMLMT